MWGEAALSASCFFCGEKWTKKNGSRSRLRNKTNPSRVRVEIVNAWEERCIVSTCRMLRIPPSHPVVAELLCTENYCAGCKQLMRDVEFNVGAIDKLQQQILTFRRMLLDKLVSNFERLKHQRKDEASNQTTSSQELFKFVFEKAQERKDKFSDQDSLFKNSHECYDDEVKEEISQELPVDEIKIKEEVCDEDDGELFYPADVFDEFLIVKDLPGNSSCEDLNQLAEGEDENSEFKIVPEEDMLVELDNEDEKVESSPDEESDSDPEWTLNSEDEFEVLEVDAEAEDLDIETPDEEDFEKADDIRNSEKPEISHSEEKSQRKLAKRKRKRCKSSGEEKKKNYVQIKSCPHLECKLQFRSFATLDSHIRDVHGDYEKLLPCDLCEKKFALNWQLQAHKSRHRKLDLKKDKKRCEFCGVWCKLEEVEEHEGRHRSREFPFSCLICEDSEDSKFLGVYHLTQHMREKHPSPDILKCPHCEKTYAQSHKLKQHILFAHDDPSKVHSCEQCKIGYQTALKLKKHIRAVHTVGKVRKQLICDKCGKICGNTSTFNLHMKRHSDELPYKCKICDKCFKLDAQVKKHEEIHAGLQFQCPDCPKIFTTERYLKQHSRCHLPRELRKYYYKTKEPAAESTAPKDAS